jgi:RNA polymerase sigma-B factor
MVQHVPSNKGPSTMTRTEQVSLMKEYRRTGEPRIREQLVTRYLPLARSLARRFASGGEPLEDLEQVAALALVKAVDGFDPDRGTAFSSYAVPCIAGAIKRHFRDCGWSVRVPRELQERAMLVHQLESELSGELGESPTVAELSQASSLGAEEVLEARAAYRALHASSLDATTQDADGDAPSLIDTLGGEDDGYSAALDRSALDSLLGALDTRDRAIIELYFREELTQSEIGDRLGYSQMHISRLLRRAVGELEKAAA